MSVTPSFSGEIQFRRYSDTSTQGQQIVFAVADREALEAFIGKEGARFMAVLVQLGDDEQPVPPAPRKDTRGPLCKEACDLAKNPAFIAWLADITGADDAGELGAANWIRNQCSIESRNELDEKPSAANVFIHAVRIPFMRYQRERKSA